MTIWQLGRNEDESSALIIEWHPATAEVMEFSQLSTEWQLQGPGTDGASIGRRAIWLLAASASSSRNTEINFPFDNYVQSSRP
jgi:hypothetical protein